MKPQRGKIAVIGKRPAEVSNTDDGNVPLSVESENLTDIIDELSHMITNAFFAKSAKTGQVFANLFRSYPNAAPQFLGRYDFRTLRLYQSESSEIQWQAVNRRPGNAAVLRV